MKLNEYGFEPTTRVTLEDFSTNYIDGLDTSKKVLCADLIKINSMINVSNSVLNIAEHATCPSYRITTETYDILVGAADQQMWVNRKGWVPFKKIKLEDELITMNGILRYVRKIEIIQQDIKMYRLDRIKNNNTYYVNGYLTCNLL